MRFERISKWGCEAVSESAQNSSPRFSLNSCSKNATLMLILAFLFALHHPYVELTCR